jgi:hypothetical protein
VNTAACPGQSSPPIPGDTGDICLALGSAGVCQQPITLIPSALTFPSQTVNTASLQTITLANASGITLNEITVTLVSSDGVANFTELDTCGLDGAPSLGQIFYLVPAQFCAITVTFTPLETCAAGNPPSQCPSPLNAKLAATVISTVGGGNNTIFTVPITGFGVSANAASISKRDFGAIR